MSTPADGSLTASAGTWCLPPSMRMSWAQGLSNLICLPARDRLSAQGIMDDMLPLVVFDTLQLGFNIIGSFVLAMLASWPMVVLVVPLAIFFVW